MSALDRPHTAATVATAAIDHTAATGTTVPTTTSKEDMVATRSEHY